VTAVLDNFSIAAAVTWQWHDSANPLAATVNGGSSGSSQTYSDGTGQANVAHAIAANRLTIAAGGNVLLKLTPGVGQITDLENSNPVTFSIVREIWIYLNPMTTAASITIGGGSDGNGANAFASFLGSAASSVIVGNGSFLHTGRPDATGFPVIANMADLLRIVNNDGVNQATVDFCFVGE
jgi:hypothetical protein